MKDMGVIAGQGRLFSLEAPTSGQKQGKLSKIGGPASTSQLPFKTPQIASNRDHRALNRGTLGGLGIVGSFLCWVHVRCP